MNRFTLWLAQGFGIGRIPLAPGTFGSLVGLGWLALLLVPGNLWVFIGGTIFGLAASVRFCGAAERILKQTDPGSVVLDEIVAVPLCFAGWVGVVFAETGQMPTPGYFFAPETLLPTVGIFLTFRVFDVVKPWPVRQSQSLPGGWGVTADDVLAAVYVNLCWFYYLGSAPGI